MTRFELIRSQPRIARLTAPQNRPPDGFAASTSLIRDGEWPQAQSLAISIKKKGTPLEYLSFYRSDKIRTCAARPHSHPVLVYAAQKQPKGCFCKLSHTSMKLLYKHLIATGSPGRRSAVIFQKQTALSFPVRAVLQ